MMNFMPWLRPTLLGPFLTTWAWFTIASSISGLVLPNGERLDQWLVLMFVASVFASLVVVGLLSADIALLRWQVRRLPTHGRAWLSSLTAPIAVWLLWSAIGWGDGDSVAVQLALIGAPIFVGPLAVRWLFGEQP